MKRLNERYRKAVVTGASSGLGRAFADKLRAEGVEVWGTSRDASRIEAAEDFHPVKLDQADPESVRAFCAWLENERPDVDLLVNNAGAGAFYPLENFPDEELKRQLDVLLYAPLVLTHTAFRLMAGRGSGAIVNVSSLAADFPLPYMPLYNTAKAGLSRFTRALQFDGTQGVALIDFMPGDYRTRFNEAAPRMEAEAAGRANLSRAWEALNAHLEAAPPPERAASDLCKALARGRSGVVRSGSFFQAGVAPFLARFGSWRTIRAVLRRYYGL